MKTQKALRFIFEEENCMKKVIICSLAAAVLFVLLGEFTLFAETTSTIPDTPAGKRVKESLDIINSGDRTQIQDFTFTQFTPSFIKLFGKERLKVGHTGGYTGINNSFSIYLNNGYTVIILSNIDLICGSPVSDIEFFISGLFF